YCYAFSLHDALPISRLLVGADALDLRLDVCHVDENSLVCSPKRWTGRRGRIRIRDWGVGTPAERTWTGARRPGRTRDSRSYQDGDRKSTRLNSSHVK